jgi:hypothetical protein
LSLMCRVCVRGVREVLGILGQMWTTCPGLDPGSAGHGVAAQRAVPEIEEKSQSPWEVRLRHRHRDVGTAEVRTHDCLVAHPEVRHARV